MEGAIGAPAVFSHRLLEPCGSDSVVQTPSFWADFFLRGSNIGFFALFLAVFGLTIRSEGTQEALRIDSERTQDRLRIDSGSRSSGWFMHQPTGSREQGARSNRAGNGTPNETNCTHGLREPRMKRGGDTEIDPCFVRVQSVAQDGPRFRFHFFFPQFVNDCCLQTITLLYIYLCAPRYAKRQEFLKKASFFRPKSKPHKDLKIFWAHLRIGRKRHVFKVWPSARGGVCVSPPARGRRPGAGFRPELPLSEGGRVHAIARPPLACDVSIYSREAAIANNPGVNATTGLVPVER